MKYNKPFDQSDPNAPYNNGNPATGTDGSIPPAEAIEYPQREIVNVIQWAFDHHYIDKQGVPCAAPTNLDLEQLRKAIQGMILAEFPTGGPTQTPITVLTANAFSYINPVTGSDTAYDGSQATVSGTKGPFATIARGLSEMTKYNLNGFKYSIFCADGTYSQQVIACPIQNGSGTVALVGNNANPAACVISSTLGSCLTLFGSGANYTVDGFRFVAQGAAKSGDKNACIWVNGSCILSMVSGSRNEFAATSNSAPHLCAQNGGNIGYGGNITISGGAAAHMEATNGIITTGEPPSDNVTITGAQNYTVAFLNCDTIGQIHFHALSMTGAGSVTGKQYSVQSNGIIQWGTSAGATPPGNTAGTTASGGQFIPF